MRSVISLYAVMEWLDTLGREIIAAPPPFGREPRQPSGKNRDKVKAARKQRLMQRRSLSR